MICCNTCKKSIENIDVENHVYFDHLGKTPLSKMSNYELARAYYDEENQYRKTFIAKEINHRLG